MFEQMELAVLGLNSRPEKYSLLCKFLFFGPVSRPETILIIVQRGSPINYVDRSLSNERKSLCYREDKEEEVKKKNYGNIEKLDSALSINIFHFFHIV